jgi:CDGSH-type Zn-finger protein
MSADDPNETVIAGRTPAILDVETGVYFWCACGRSAAQPFCDGSHKVTNFRPLRVEITEKRKIAWCMCKHSKNKPYCDGTHSIL